MMRLVEPNNVYPLFVGKDTFDHCFATLQGYGADVVPLSVNHVADDPLQSGNRREIDIDHMPHAINERYFRIERNAGRVAVDVQLTFLAMNDQETLEVGQILYAFESDQMVAPALHRNHLDVVKAQPRLLHGLERRTAAMRIMNIIDKLVATDESITGRT